MQKEEVKTFNETYKYKFQSGFNYSVINIDSSDINSKRYCDLDIEYEYICLDEEIFNEENKAFTDFDNKANCDFYYSVKKIVDIKGEHSKNIISFCNFFIVILDRLIFLICTLLCLCQIFKYVISSLWLKRQLNLQI